MRVTIRQKNLNITPALKIYIESKLLKPMQRSLKSVVGKDLPILDLEFGRTTKHHRKGKVYHAEANLSLGKHLLHAEREDEDIRAAIDLLEEEMEREIIHYRDRAISLARRGARRVKKDFHFARAARFYRKGRIQEEGS